MWLVRVMGWRAMMHLQLIVFGKTHHKVPGHDIVGMQVFVHDHTSHVVDAAGNAPGRVGQMATNGCASRTKLAHHAG